MYNFFSKRLNGNRKGFTLVELLVVMAILAVLIAIAVMNMGTTTNSARVSKHNSHVRELFSAATMWYANNATQVDNSTVFPADEKTLGESELKSYFNASKAPKTHSGGDFTVKVTKAGKVTVTPGLQMLNNDGEIVFDSENDKLLQGTVAQP